MIPANQKPKLLHKGVFMIRIASVLAISLFAVTVFGQELSTSKTSYADDDVSSKGFRVSIVKPMLSGTLSLSDGENSASASSNIKDALGISVGYANLPIQELGWSANLTHIGITQDSKTMDILRVDGNLAYAFSEIVNIKGGFNLSTITSATNEVNVTPALGYQASVGLQLHEDVWFRRRLHPDAAIPFCGQCFWIS